MRYERKYPNEIQATCGRCGLVYTYQRQSRSALVYWLAIDETRCSCFQAYIPPETFRNGVEYAQVYPRCIRLVTRKKPSTK